MSTALSYAATALFAVVASAGSVEDPPVRRLEVWPEVDKALAGQLKKEVSKLRKARTEEMARQAEEWLGDFGAGAAPALLQALGKEKKDDARERVLTVLHEITGAEHTRLLAAEFEAKALAVRVFCMRRAATFPDNHIQDAAETALETARKRKEKKRERSEIEAAARLTVRWVLP